MWETCKRAVQTVIETSQNLKNAAEAVYDDTMAAARKERDLENAQKAVDDACRGGARDREACANARYNFGKILTNSKTHKDRNKELDAVVDCEKDENRIAGKIVERRDDRSVKNTETLGQTAIGLFGGLSSRDSKDKHGRTKMETRRNPSQSTKSNEPEEPGLK